MARHVLKRPREMSSLRQLVAFLAALLVLGVVGNAHAQATTLGAASVVVNSAGIKHSIPRDGYRQNTLLNYADCKNGDVITFPLTIANRGTASLQAWVGTGCGDMGIRTSASQTQCWLVDEVAPSGPNANVPSVDIAVSSIVWGYTLGGATTAASSGTGGSGGDTSSDAGTTAGTSGTGGDSGGDTSAGTGGTTTATAGSTGTTSNNGFGRLIAPDPASCETPNPSLVTGPTNVTIFFLLVDSSTSAANAMATWVGTFKLIGPPPPTDVTAGIGGNLLVVDFSPNTNSPDQTTNGYNIYCDPRQGAAVESDAGADAGAQVCPTPPTSAVLVAGEKPPTDASYQCGSAQKTSSGSNATSLVNGVAYTVAVAAVDTYENTGLLSNLYCEVPQPVTGFFKAYQNAGGKGGGGYCSFSPRREPVPLVMLVAFAGCLLLRRRRAA